MVRAVEKLYLMVEVVGCPTICRHCWAQGVGYQAMPVGDVAFVLEQAHRFCEEHALGFGAYPMHEVAAHPQARAILRLFADHVGACEFDGRWSGHVDLGDLGVADRWADLAVASWSSGWNYGHGWEELLLDAYGIKPDAERTRY